MELCCERHPRADRAMTAVVQRVVEQNLDVYRASESRLREDVSQEAQVANDYRGRLVYELLQNADDAMEFSESRDDRVVFVVTDDCLWMANSGRSLTDEDVQGLCGLGASSKATAEESKRASIGHKGLGFKSVLEITDAPSVYSRSLSFRLGASEARHHVNGLWDELGRVSPTSFPAMRFPKLIEESDDLDRWTSLRDEGLNTAFRFPFRQDMSSEQRAALVDLLLELPLTTVLFLKHLESVEVRVDRDERSEVREWRVSRQVRREHQWVGVPGMEDSDLYRVTVSQTGNEPDSIQDSAAFLVAHDARVEIGPHRQGLVGPAWEGVELAEVSIATLVNESDSPMPEEWKHFHVFLPTEEPCPYPMLVNGAFSTDLSRQRIAVHDDIGDYNSHLVREAARLFGAKMLPELREQSTERALSALDRGEDPSVGGNAAELFHESLVEVLASEPLLPTEAGGLSPINECVLPTPLLKEQGEQFRSMLVSDAEWEDAEFPAAGYCRGRWARVATDHGARKLSPAECLEVLGTLADPQKSSIQEHDSGFCEVDPVLELSALIWRRASYREQKELKSTARRNRLFPVQRNEDGTIERVALGGAKAFYPPQSTKGDFPLPGLQFMCHSVCWGALNPNERGSLLGEQISAWSDLFDIKEFGFQEVMQASVLPFLAFGVDPSSEEFSGSEDLHNPESLAEICQLAGRSIKPDSPLRFQRLGNDRAFFNLSRLPVPCTDGSGGRTWVPAYQAYFGRAWLGEDSFEKVIDALPDDVRVEAPMLVPPEELVGLLASDDDEPVPETDDEDLSHDEVGLDEDVDSSLETSERERWLNFLSWIGVNRSLRLIHFHDVEDHSAGWLTTKNLCQPGGWAFRELGETWRSYKSQLEARLTDSQKGTDVVPYLYEVHDLDHAVPLIRAAERDASGEVSIRLFEHLVKHWGTYERLADAKLALVKKHLTPSRRQSPKRASPEEITSVGDNLWLHRLRNAGICPTSHGPRRPETTWRRSQELDRRFSSRRNRRDAGDLMPVLDQISGVSDATIRGFCERFGIRSEMNPSTFKIQDADLLCRRIKSIYGEGEIDSSDLRNVIKPVYRAMFELLSGKARSVGDPPLADSPLLAKRDDGLHFVPASEVLFASTAGFKERSGITGNVSIFVIEADRAAVAPLTSVFGCRDLQRALEWRPNPGECPFDQSEYVRMRNGLTQLMAPLLARIRAERTNPQDQSRDRQNLEDFVELLEPVGDLELTCRLDGEVLPHSYLHHGYYVKPRSGPQPFQGFIEWSGRSWPPDPEIAQRLAMALADTLGVNLVEILLAFISSDDEQRRRLLRIAGATEHYRDVSAELAERPKEVPTEQEGDTSESEEPRSRVIEPTSAPEAGTHVAEPVPSGPGKPLPAEPPVPLHTFESLRLEGESLIVKGNRIGKDRHYDGSPERGSSGGISSNRAAIGTNRAALDALGMKIAIAYEVHRLHKDASSVATIAGGEISSSNLRDPDLDGTFVVDVHTPEAVSQAESLSNTVERAMKELEANGISRIHPGFDLLVIRGGEIDRLIELKSSGGDPREQAMSWNEWKSASNSKFRDRFWLYLVGNLRADLHHVNPYVRAIEDPFGNLVGQTVESRQVRRSVKLRVQEFPIAEHLYLTVTSPT